MQYNHELDRYRIESAETLRNCMVGRYGIVCLVAPTGKAHTYKFMKPREEAMFPDDVRFVYALHETAYFYLGMIEKDKFRLTQHSRFEDDTETVKGAKYLMKMANDESFFASSPMKCYHSGKCSVCGRKLVGEKSIKAGIGTKCRIKLRARTNV